ncbi:transcription factor FER-LIKE IRON DEFICIENCY-INDUCED TRANSCRIPTION FACTOR-like protein [Cinnamomum micranthum f. kanehirae]|uniref:Transcription factor FER-LIKE IRON DEFICIENCY-INDUCED TRANSCRIPTION FACTOR-like protein n=1 Tax=Cinnamomum micranthum f. kanehirae TaxID=337451 RepID=A0A3S3NQZ7_9MAGN|nr:transcription factor FER-LIKE IRON DEFICIENCY-INDUCED TRANSCRIPTION FACTOR-like protein [Cinnamomum micranthum f. kanehirae]
MDLSENRSFSDDSDDEDSLHENGRPRTRIAQQIEALQSLIPNSTGTDERSILEETRDYLLRLHRESEEIEKELAAAPSSSRSQGEEDASQGPHILQVETEELMEGRFVVKMEWRKRDGVGGHVQRVIEGLDLRMISIVVNEKNPDVMSSTAFVEVISQHYYL